MHGYAPVVHRLPKRIRNGSLQARLYVTELMALTNAAASLCGTTTTIFYVSGKNSLSVFTYIANAREMHLACKADVQNAVQIFQQRFIAGCTKIHDYLYALGGWVTKGATI